MALPQEQKNPVQEKLNQISVSEKQQRELNSIVLFDGECNLCNGLVDFIVRRDTGKTIRFIPLQSGQGQRLLSDHRLSQQETDSIVFILEGTAFIKSKAVLRILSLLGNPWRYFYIMRHLPRPILDWIYDRIAKNRFRIFGRPSSCRLPF